MKWRVLITCPHLQQTINQYSGLFAERDIEIELTHVVQQLSESELLDIIDRFDGVIAGDDEFTANVLEKGKRLKVIAKWGIGVDAIDLDAAKRLGIQVFNTPNIFADEVADVVIGYIILLSRQLHKLDQSVRNGEWQKIRGVSLRDKTLGVVGVGSIGQAVVRRSLIAGMYAMGYDVMSVPESFLTETGIKPTDLNNLLQSSDFISLNCTLTSQNHHMIGTNEFHIMRDGVYIINTSRGALIDESALVEALRLGKVAGAALDVFEQEPLPLDSPLRSFDNCIFGTHNSSNTIEAIKRTNEASIHYLFKGLGIEEP